MTGMDALRNDRAPLVVITGGLGRVATVLLPHLRQHYRLRLIDRAIPDRAVPLEDGVEAQQADIGDPDAAYKVFEGADAILHLAANGSPWQSWDSVYAANVRPTQVVLDAAAAHGVPKLVLASSVHAVGEYNRPAYWPVSPRLDPRPCCPYGLGKVVMEVLARTHADRTGASVTCLRLGLTGWGLTFGVSANSRNHWDITSARTELGYRPQDDSELLADRTGPASGPVCRLFDDSETSE